MTLCCGNLGRTMCRALLILGTVAVLACAVTAGAAEAGGVSGRLTNLSVRAVTAGGAEVLSAGFVVAGDGPKRLLIWPTAAAASGAVR